MIIDFETYSECDISKAGALAYAQHPSTRPLCLGYLLPGQARAEVWQEGGPLPLPLLEYLAGQGPILAHNAEFDRAIWEHVCVARLGWPAIAADRWRCTLARSAAWNLPRALGAAGEVLGLPVQKDRRGKELIRLCCVPRKNASLRELRECRLPIDSHLIPKKLRVKDGFTADEVLLRKEERRVFKLLRRKVSGFPVYSGAFQVSIAALGYGELKTAVHAQNLQELAEYCRRDVETTAALNAVVPDLSPDELEVWQTHTAINNRGVTIDSTGLDALTAVTEASLAPHGPRLAELTGGAITSPNQSVALARYLGMPSVDASSVTEALANPLLDGRTREILEIRQAAGSSSVKKVYTMRDRTNPATGRAHGLFIYHGARTGRVTGESIQPTNMPRGNLAVHSCGCGAWYSGTPRVCANCGGHPVGHKVNQEWCLEAAEWASALAESGAGLDWFQVFYPDALAAVSGSLRALMVAGPGHDLIGSDYSSIEAVVLAELAGEEWRQKLFREGGKIYEESAARIIGVPVQELLDHKARTGHHHPARNAIGKVAELALGYQGWIGSWKAFNGPGTDEEIKANILAWRAASPAIPQLWASVETACVQAIQSPGWASEVRGLTIWQEPGGPLYIRLLSGRCLTYHRPSLEMGPRGPGIRFWGWNTNPTNGARGWVPIETWGGRLVENIVQATARDIQWFGLVALERAGYLPVLHVYDEDVVEVPEGWGSVEEMESIMSTMPPWAAGWPVRAAGGWRGKRFRK